MPDESQSVPVELIIEEEKEAPVLPDESHFEPVDTVVDEEDQED